MGEVEGLQTVREGVGFAGAANGNELMSAIVEEVPDGYIAGLGRDYPHPPLAHLYKGDFSDPGLPMCRHGWNRDGGESYSIWRRNTGRKGICRICLRRARLGLDGVPPVGGRADG